MTPPELDLSSPSSVEATYKGRDFEGILDLYFYRKVGFKLALLFARLRMSPAAVTLLGGAVGILAGHLYYYRDLSINLVGMALHVFANALDNADGQLARLTNKQSRAGRILDGVVDHLIFLNIYFHLTLRALTEGASPSIWWLTLGAAISHGLQASAADYARNAYLYFAKRRPEFDSASALNADYQKMSWLRQPWEKFSLAFYRNITREQEILSPGTHRLHATVEGGQADTMRDLLQANYRNAVRPMFKWWSLLMNNTRMLLLFALLLIGKPVWYLWLELTGFNLLLVWLLIRQEKMSESFLALVTSPLRRD